MPPKQAAADDNVLGVGVENHFRVRVNADDRAAVVIVGGELDLASSPVLEGELERVIVSDSELVILDLRELDFMDSTGLRVLVKANQRVQEVGKRLGLVRGGEQVQRLLSLTGVAERLTVVDTPDELLSPRPRG